MSRLRYLGAVLLTIATAEAHAHSEAICVSVHADRTWQRTGIDVVADQKVCVQASGLWSHGEEAGGITPFHGARGYIGKPKEQPAPIVPWPYARIGTLLGKIDDGLAFPIEDELCFVADAAGELLLTMNDVPGSFDDNRGALRVRIATGRDWKTMPRGGDPQAAGANGRCSR